MRQDIGQKPIRNKMRVMTVSTICTENCLKPRIIPRDICIVINLCRFPFKLDFNICQILTIHKIVLENLYKPPLQAFIKIRRFFPREETDRHDEAYSLLCLLKRVQQ